MPRRRNLAGVDNATAKRLLDAYLPVAYAIRPIFRRIDDATFRATSEDAILEAHLTLKPDRASEGTWVRKLLFWRLSEVRTHSPETSLGTDPAVLNGVDPEEAFLRATVVHMLGLLSVRQQQIVDGRMRGETYEELGSQLGISHARAHREGKRAFRILRDLLEGSQ